MIRVATFFCFAVSALACLALYHVSEQTRVARSELSVVSRQIVVERESIHTLQAEWARVGRVGVGFCVEPWHSVARELDQQRRSGR